MGLVRVHNPQTLGNPRKKKPWTYDQAATRKDEAERFVRDVLEDDERADEIAAMSVQDYAVERGKEINPQLRGDAMKRKVSAQEQAATGNDTRDNPAAVAIQTAARSLEKQEEQAQQIRSLQKENDDLKDKVASAREVLDCDDSECTAEEHLEDIRGILSGEEEEGEE